MGMTVGWFRNDMVWRRACRGSRWPKVRRVQSCQRRGGRSGLWPCDTRNKRLKMTTAYAKYEATIVETSRTNNDVSMQTRGTSDRSS
ncbi:hypothetical protein BDA96_03G313300 [Sorghum bicolor]|uniref:Uncharacterized protein n=1 Tax=Sorghum bicolor TaxID=4558 RepID=A0A921RFC1_SORBI|nr:hypothetical protein BDA96_03G313300 [Sorghum bicolor]